MIARSARIYGNCNIEGNVTIGPDTLVRYADIHSGTTIGCSCLINHGTVIEHGANIPNGAVIGRNARVGPGAQVKVYRDRDKHRPMSAWYNDNGEVWMSWCSSAHTLKDWDTKQFEYAEAQLIAADLKIVRETLVPEAKEYWVGLGIPCELVDDGEW